VDRIVEHVPSVGGGTGAASIDEDICAAAGYESMRFDELPSDDFLQTDI
jgi:hypothetical protein